MTRNNPRHRWPTTARQIGKSSRAKRHGSPIALSVYEDVVVSGDDDRDQYVRKTLLSISTKVIIIFIKEKLVY